MHRVLAVASLIAVSLSMACQHGGEGTSAGATSPAGVTTSPGATAEGAEGADITNALLTATNQLTITDAQKATVHTLDEQLESNERDTGAAFKAMRADLAGQVRAGTIDTAKMQADESAAATALQTHMAKEADTLNGLHAALDPSQRKAAVAAVRAKRAGLSETKRGETSAAGQEDAAKRRLDHLTQQLGLDAGQQQQVAALLAAQSGSPRSQKEDHQGRMDALLTAFEGDTFDAKTAAPTPSPSAADGVRERMDREATFLSKLVPILRSDQRDKLASNIENGGGRESDGE